MKLKSSFFYTIRENIKDEESISGNLLVRSGMIKKVGNGIYMYLPLGLRVLKNIEKIVREEMNRAGACELIMPNMLPEDIYVESGRREVFGDSMFGLKDRYKRNYVLGPTHEELFVMAAREKVKSYKDFPFNLYQIGIKYRDEPRPRFGLIRIREFVMKDAYSFDIDLDGLDVAYKKMFDAYKRIFDRIGIEYKIVTADTGAMGGLLSEEFQAVAPIGEDTLVLCPKCNYSSNIEVSEALNQNIVSDEEKLTKELVETPSAGTIEEVATMLNEVESKFVKTLIYKIDNEFYACLVAGDREINETKLSKLLKAFSVELAEPEDVTRITKANVGFAGPIGLDIKVIIDNEIVNKKNFIVGANLTDYHYKNVNLSDFEYELKADIKNVKEGDPCPLCSEPLIFKKGIEIGNTFKLGTKYSEDLNLYYTDKFNNLHPVVMGSYGIGIERIMASVVEQNNDELGIIWPTIIAPFKVAIVLIDSEDETQNTKANELYDKLNSMGIDTVLDDRDIRPGVKFNDIDLIGIPIRITIGNKIKDNLLELKLRSEKIGIDINETEILEKIKELI
ncbi:MAG: proline--tRNA ligase [Bacilli bacterium]|nr:proline--tRNA ligase [Bacilli bacterium]MDD4718978.1 proline--tRNA ligase [Bacilli bacterium]